MGNGQRYFWRWTVFSILVLAGCVNAGVVQAHNPGLSFAELELGHTGITARFSFSQPDIAALSNGDRDGDGFISDEELTILRPRLVEWAHDLVSVTIDAQSSPMTTPPQVELEQDDGVRFTLRFQRREGATLTVRAPMIGRFAGGHRQFLSITGPGGKIHTGILSAAQPGLTLNLERP